MTLEAGTKLGPYEIIAPIGAGGMGEVYEARDTKLDRHVAIKVLPAELANDEERLARFEREAKLLASLNHPNIAGIYGFESGGLVLELVEGPTLAERIAQGPIPVEEATDIAKQIADALAAGHEAGVIHRDLKPANVKLKEDGTVKVLDYGLAKAFEDPATGSVDSELSQSPTLTRGTQVGVILGTAAYMSPEQAKGKRVDKRTDVWAFGAVVYEMLTGKRAFEGDDVSDTLAAVLRAEPDFDRLPRETPASLRRTLELCLTKNAKDRVHDITDVRLAIEGAFETASGASEPAVAKPSALPWIGVAVVASLLSALVVWSLMRPEPPAVTRFTYEVPDANRLRSTGRAVIAASPDGRRFLYNSMGGLFVREMELLDPLQLTEPEEVSMHPFFSPDGRSLAYFQGGQLKRLAVGGGAAVVVGPAPNASGGHWAPDGTILFAVNEGIVRVSANGGTPELVVPAEDGERLDAPQLMPDGESVLFSAVLGDLAPEWDGARVEVFSLGSGERTVLWEGGSDARYLRSGHLIYALGDALFAVSFDPDSLRVTSGPVSMVEGVVRAGFASSANYAVTDDGTLLFLADAARDDSLTWVDRSGTVEEIETIPTSDYLYPRLSPDGGRVAVIGDGDARVFDLASGRESRLTSEGATTYLGWMPSGADVTYTSGTSSGIEIFSRPADGSGEARQLTAIGGRVDFETWAPDGRTFAAHQHAQDGTIMEMYDFDGEEAKPTLFLDAEYRATGITFSPDGRYVAYASFVSGQREIYIRPFPGPGGQTTVSVGGGREPVWAQTGEIFYRRPGDYMMMVVEVSTDPVLTVGPPVELFPGSGMVGGAATARYSVTADGQRFLMRSDLAPRGAADVRPKIIIVQNWIEELKARVPN